MAKKQTRRSISVSGDTYNAVRDYCDQHGLSASGLVTDLLNKYLIDNANGPPPQGDQAAEPSKVEPPKDPVAEEQVVSKPMTPVRIAPPQSAKDFRYPDRRGPGFRPLPEGETVSLWVVTAEIEISRKRQIDAQMSVETLLENLVHRRMVNQAHIMSVNPLDESQ